MPVDVRAAVHQNQGLKVRRSRDQQRVTVACPGEIIGDLDVRALAIFIAKHLSRLISRWLVDPHPIVDRILKSHITVASVGRLHTVRQIATVRRPTQRHKAIAAAAVPILRVGRRIEHAVIDEQHSCLINGRDLPILRVDCVGLHA